MYEEIFDVSIGKDSGIWDKENELGYVQGWRGRAGSVIQERTFEETKIKSVEGEIGFNSIELIIDLENGDKIDYNSYNTQDGGENYTETIIMTIDGEKVRYEDEYDHFSGSVVSQAIKHYMRERKSHIEEYAKGGVTKNVQIIEQFLDENTDNSLGNISIHHSTIGGVMLLRNYGTLIAKRQGRRVYISNKTYSKTTTAIQNSIERLAEKRGLKVYRIDDDKFAKGGKIDYSKRTTKDFKLGELVYDTRNKRYGTIIGIYDEYNSDKYEVRLDSDGMQGTEYLRKLGEEGDKGTKKQLFQAVAGIERLRRTYPENNYPKLINNPFYAKGGVTEKRYLGLKFKTEEEADKYFEDMSSEDFKALGDVTLVFNGQEYLVYENWDTEGHTRVMVGYAKGGEVKKKGNELLIGGLAGVLIGIFLNR
tara:strand:- start:391 stop:1653 length:1263 start_codon:yes stop_codon:yes gene_type:complete